mgnify:FL=1|jgi:hypothetical protein
MLSVQWNVSIRRKMYEGRNMSNVVQVKAQWLKTDNEYSKSGISGGWEIVKSPKAYPEINGVFRSQDFEDWTVEKIEKEIKDSANYKFDMDVDISVNVCVVKDERVKKDAEESVKKRARDNCSMDDFFGAVS